MDVKQLIDIGLTKNQAQVYLELIKKPGQTAGEIAKKLSIDRSFTYGILNSLVDKGLASYITKENRRVFQALDPENLLKEIEEKRDKTLALVKELKLIKKQTKEEKSVKIYEGKAGLKVYIRELLESDMFYTLGGGGKLSILDKLKYEYPHYLKELKKKKMSGKLITSKQNIKIMKELFKHSRIQIKTLENLKSQVNFIIFKNKLIIYSAEEKPFVIVIEDKNVSEALKTYFNKLWQIAK